MIRPMTEADWPRVAAIYQQGIDSGISTFTAECPSREAWDKAHLKVCRTVWEEDGEIAGWLALSPVSAREVYRGVAEVSIYLDKRFQGRGIGRAMMEDLIREAPRCGFWSLFSVILAVNTASIAFHRKCGFREIGYRERIARDRFGVWQNTVLMEYRL